MFPLFLHHLIMDRSSRCLLLLLALCIAPIIYFFSNGGWNSSSPRKSRGLPPANATLGFGAVVAVSHATSPRRSALVFAANMTSIDLTIPDQPVWTDADLEAFHSPKGSRIKKGSALAWMGHLSALKWFLSTDLETAIILEDDVDWDIHLRTSQVPLAAAAMQQLLTTHPPTKTPARRGARSTYWGPLDWELLFLGHCGDIFPESQLQESAFLAYADDSLMPAARLHTKTAAFLRRLGMPEHVRLAHRSHWPLCTFAYGVTRASARRILDEYSNEATAAARPSMCGFWRRVATTTGAATQSIPSCSTISRRRARSRMWMRTRWRWRRGQVLMPRAGCRGRL